MTLDEFCLKMRMLWLYRLHVPEWWRDVWKQDAGARMCCDGHMCGCYGEDYWSYWEWLLEPKREVQP